jgi:hypothetical protein
VEPTLYEGCENIRTGTGSHKKVIKWMDRIENKFQSEKEPEKTVISGLRELITVLSVKLQVTDRRKEEVEAALQDTNANNKKLEAEIKELRKKCEDKNRDKKKRFEYWRMRADVQKRAKERT